MNISRPFIFRPVATTLLTIAVAMAGGLAYFYLPVAPLPQVDYPAISVSASLPGASPETMATTVATPLERQFGNIAGITEMSSTSNLGSTSINMTFVLSRDINAAARDVQSAINASLGNLPSNLPGLPTYRKSNPADAPILILALTSNVYDAAHMYDAASTILEQKLSQIDGVGQVVVGGGALPAVRIEIDPIALNNLGLGLTDVATAIGAANANRPKGSIDGQFQSWSILANDQLLKARDYAQQIITVRNNGPIRVSDVATVLDSVEDVRNAGMYKDKTSVLLIVFRQPGANIIDTVDAVLAAKPQLEAEIPADMKINVVMDRTTTIRASVKDVQFTLVLSLILVVLVVFIFLRTLRSTLIPAVAVPVSLIATFGVMYLCGYSLDNLSLMAMTIATGFVVDDAIVVIENISRHLEAGMEPMAAALLGAEEIGFTVLSISVSLIAVFIPILLMSGLVGRLFREFAVTLSVAVAISMVVSLTTTPMMCARLLKSHSKVHHNRAYILSEAAFDWIIGCYRAMLTWVLDHQFGTLLVTLGTIGFTFYLYKIVPSGFFPQQDVGRLTGQIKADQSCSFQEMQKLLHAYVAKVCQDPAVDNAVAFTGGGRSSTNVGNMYVALKPLEVRQISADDVVSRLRPELAKITGATLFLQPQQDLRIGARPSAAQYQFTLEGDNFADLSQWAPQVLAKLKTLKSPTLADLNSDQQNNGRAADFTYDRDTAMRMNLTAQAIDSNLYDAFGQSQITTMYMLLNQYHVVMEFAPHYWQNPDGLGYVYLRPGAPSASSTFGTANTTITAVPAGGSPQVPLNRISSWKLDNTALAINHTEQSPSVTISFNLDPGIALGDAVQEIEDAMFDMGLPPSIQPIFQGTAQAYQDTLASLPYLIAAALFAVYIILGILYESYIHPITILSTLPSAGVGAFLALLICHLEFDVMSIIGIILLIGIVKKNAIMMIDFALVAERTEGKSPRDAIFQACILRFRPIMMTTMAALLGGLPLALGHGTGAELRRPLGVSIVGGLIFSQMLTLFTTPVVYLYMDRLRLWLGDMGSPVFTQKDNPSEPSGPSNAPA